MIQRNIQDEIKKALNLRVEIEVVLKGTLPKSDYKAKRFLDRRKDGDIWRRIFNFIMDGESQFFEMEK